MVLIARLVATPLIAFRNCRMPIRPIARTATLRAYVAKSVRRHSDYPEVGGTKQTSRTAVRNGATWSSPETAHPERRLRRRLERKPSPKPNPKPSPSQSRKPAIALQTHQSRQPFFISAHRSKSRACVCAEDSGSAKKTAIARTGLEAMLATCDESLEGVRDRALLCFGFASGGRRRSEIAAADMQDLRRTAPDSYVYRLEHSKTQQAGVTLSTFIAQLTWFAVQRAIH